MSTRWTAVWIASLALAGSALAADWPQWRGPDRTGHADAPGLAAGWKDGVRELWRATLGPGYASVAVADGVVYAMASRDGEEQLVALNAASGVEQWRARVGPFWGGGQYEGPRATPTVVGDKVIGFGGHGGLVAVDKATGTRLWAVDIAATYDGKAPNWGFSGSPLVSDGLIYLTTGSTSGSAIVALKVADGSLVWKQGSFPAGYSSPIRATLAGKDVVVVFTGKAAVAVTPDTGTVVWEYPWITDYDVNAATPVILGGNRVFLASGYGVGGAALLVGADGTLTELWRSTKMKNRMATSVLVGKTLYGFNESYLTAVDATTGDLKWTESGYGRGSLVEADGHLVVLSETCELSLVEASPAKRTTVGAPITVGPAGPCWTAPAIANGVIYARDYQELVAYEVMPMGPALPGPGVPAP